jgi:hypothetical protein
MAKLKKPVAARVTIEWDDANHPRLNARNGSLDKTTKLTGDGDEFTPDQIIANLKLDLGDPSAVREEQLGGKKQKVVDPYDVHLKVTYQGQHPTVGWWNGAKWVKFKGVTYDDKTSVADVILPAQWPIDPPIGTSP